MEERLISKETAVLAKEKGFDVEVRSYFDFKKFGDKSVEFYGKLDANNLMIWNVELAKNIPANYISAPSQALLQKWLREKHNLYICISAEFYKTGINHTLQILCYNPNLSESDYYDNDKCTGMYGDNAEFNTYEEALEFGLQKALTFVP